jgi:hypothetical protein
MKLSLVFATTLSSCAIFSMTTVGLSSQAQAGTISGKSSGTWVNPSLLDNNTQLVYTGVDTNSFTWGEAVPGTPPNQLIFTGDSFSADIGSWFKIGNLDYFNGTVYADTGVDNVTLNLALNFNNQVSVSQIFPVSFHLENTPNNNINLKDPSNADSVKWNTILPNSSFTLGGNNYTLEIERSSPGSQTTGITALEGDQITAGFYARVNSSDVQSAPSKDVPEAPSILGSLLVGGYLIYRKKFFQVKTK